MSESTSPKYRVEVWDGEGKKVVDFEEQGRWDGSLSPKPSLAEFLLARIAEDEAAARLATPGPWVQLGASVDGARHQPVVMSGFDSAGSLQDSCDDEDAAHIARHDPARVLAECEAKRRIVELSVEYLAPDASPWYAEQVLLLLAVPYADHPDYREEWAL